MRGRPRVVGAPAVFTFDGDPDGSDGPARGETHEDPWRSRDNTAVRPDAEGDTDTRGPRSDEGRRLAADWVTVLAAHSGAGASTVALIVSDAAASVDRRVHLVDNAHPTRSGLVAAASAELGTDDTGAWRRGSRLGVTIDRRLVDATPCAWPTLSDGQRPTITVLDLGLTALADLDGLVRDRSRLVVVCRATVPGMRLTEQALGRLSGLPIVLAAIGPRRWPGMVNASLGPRLHGLRTTNRVVPVPVHRNLEITGLTHAPLPKPLLEAGRVLWRLLDADLPAAAPASTSSAPTQTGARR